MMTKLAHIIKKIETNTKNKSHLSIQEILQDDKLPFGSDFMLIEPYNLITQYRKSAKYIPFDKKYNELALFYLCYVVMAYPEIGTIDDFITTCDSWFEGKSIIETPLP